LPGAWGSEHREVDSKAFLALLAGCVGNKVSLTIDAGLYKGIYPSKIEDVDEENIGLAHPLLRGALLPVHRSVQLKMKVETEGGVYFSVVSITRGFTHGTLPLLWVAPVGEAQKIQRRYFVRVPCLLKTAFFRLEGEEYRPEKEEWHFVTAKDISLGGIGFSVPQDRSGVFCQGNRYLLGIAVQDRTFLLVGKIVKKMTRDDLLELGVAFEGLPSSVEKCLGGFIRQQELAGRQS